METRMAHMTWAEISNAIGDGKMVIVPTGATEAHGPHLPTDVDTHQAEEMAATFIFIAYLLHMRWFVQKRCQSQQTGTITAADFTIER